MERCEIECWLDSMDRKIHKIEKPEEGDFFQACEYLKVLLNGKSYDDGYNDGKSEAYDDGYEDGKKMGYDEGFRHGKLEKQEIKCKPIETGKDEIYFDCSLCEGESIQEGFKFCPDCGTEIDW